MWSELSDQQEPRKVLSLEAQDRKDEKRTGFNYADQADILLSAAIFILQDTTMYCLKQRSPTGGLRTTGCL